MVEEETNPIEYNHANKHVVEGILLTPSQSHIYEQLLLKSEGAARAYLGGLSVLKEDGNPDRIAQSAHSIREMTCILSRLPGMPAVTDDGSEVQACQNCGYIESSQRKETKKNADKLVRRLKVVIDPQGHSHKRLDIYREWNDLHRQFIGIAHHGTTPSINEYTELIRRLEAFLNRFIFNPHIASRAEIDTIIAQGANGLDWQNLRMILSRTLSEERYFFSRAECVNDFETLFILNLE